MNSHTGDYSSYLKSVAIPLGERIQTITMTASIAPYPSALIPGRVSY